MIKCKYCNENKDETIEFYPTNQVCCKRCLSGKSSARMRKHPVSPEKRKYYRERYKEKQREYYHKWYAENGRQRKSGYAICIKSWQDSNPIAMSVRNEIAQAIRMGKLIRARICSSCNKEKRTYAHHPDYQKPLEVIWICASCHKLLHNKLKEK